MSWLFIEMFISKSFPQLLVWSTLSYLHLQLQTVTCLRNLNSVFPRWPIWLTDSQLRTRLIVRSFAKATPDAVISPSWRPIFPSTLGSQTSSATCGRSVSQRLPLSNPPDHWASTLLASPDTLLINGLLLLGSWTRETINAFFLLLPVPVRCLQCPSTPISACHGWGRVPEEVSGR